MAHNFGSLLFTPAVKALQERHGSRRQYARFEAEASRDRLGPDEKAFLAARDSFYIASVGSTGWPHVQHRGGPPGFIKVLDDSTLAFANFRGNKQYISMGNLSTDDRVALIFVDYPAQARLKLLGHAEVFDLHGPKANAAKALLACVRHPDYKAEPESVFVIHVEAFDWNCPQHITPRYTKDQIQEAVAPLEKRLQELEQENRTLRQKLAERYPAHPSG
ncbi:MAG: pyridoxamine 5'-phosphate oxidase family protein [Acidobacteriota bacterium]|nr:pyridoxamine 5'-phosphate oxidase family protein [Acidobacteriota bacterium]